jgi:hypothetical protein
MAITLAVPCQDMDAEFGADLQRMLDEERLAAAVAARRQLADRAELARLETTMLDALALVAELGTEVDVTVAGRHRAGTVRRVLRDGIELATGRDVRVIPLGAIDQLVVRGPHPTGAAEFTTTLSLAEHLADLGGDRPDVVVWLRSTEAIRGRLESAGPDVVLVRSSAGMHYLSISSVSEVVLEGSG